VNFSKNQLNVIDGTLQRISDGEHITSIGGLAGSGKAQPLDCLVQTPGGPKEIGTLEVGNTIFNYKGGIQKVTGVFPQGVKDCYRVTFRDGTSTRCCGEHLWTTYTSKKNLITKTLNEMIEIGILRSEGDMKFKVPLPDPVLYFKKIQTLPAYLVGLLIGDGSMVGSTPCLSFDKSDTVVEGFKKIASELGIKYKLRDTSIGGSQTTLVPKDGGRNWIMDEIKSYGLNCYSYEKFIPEEYLRGDFGQRMDMLQGLMDADGSCRKNRSTYCTTSRKLADQFMELVRSLGFVAVEHSLSPRPGKRDCFQINVKSFICPFRFSEKKKSSWKVSSKNPPSKYIRSVEKIEDCEQVCISVSSEDNLYLTDDYIVTHNTTITAEIIKGVKEIKLPYLVLTPTGKAAHVLQTKKVPAATIHSFLYNLDGISEDEKGNEIMYWSEKDELKEKPKVVFVDEYSMVNSRLHDDLADKDFQLVCIGDYGQLPPIGGDPGIIDNPTFVLDKIFRQADGNDIIDFAHMVRNGEDWEGREWKNVELLYCDLDQLVEENETDQFICGMNATRVGMNKRVREKMEFNESAITATDKIICLRNSRDYGVFNGQQFLIQKTGSANGIRESFHAELLDEVGQTHDVEVSKLGFNQRTVKNKEDIPKDQLLADFGYCITCHKSQGSQWDDVIVINEECKAWDSKRWLYTAATRPSKNLKVMV